ncbi:hypothetical protein Unana1_01980 [Umbelopsis nana]
MHSTYQDFQYVKQMLAPGSSYVKSVGIDPAKKTRLTALNTRQRTYQNRYLGLDNDAKPNRGPPRLKVKEIQKVLALRRASILGLRLKGAARAAEKTLLSTSDAILGKTSFLEEVVIECDGAVQVGTKCEDSSQCTYCTELKTFDQPSVVFKNYAIFLKHASIIAKSQYATEIERHRLSETLNVEDEDIEVETITTEQKILRLIHYYRLIWSILWHYDRGVLSKLDFILINEHSTKVKAVDLRSALYLTTIYIKPELMTNKDIGPNKLTILGLTLRLIEAPDCQIRADTVRELSEYIRCLYEKQDYKSTVPSTLAEDIAVMMDAHSHTDGRMQSVKFRSPYKNRQHALPKIEDTDNLDIRHGKVLLLTVLYLSGITVRDIDLDVRSSCLSYDSTSWVARNLERAVKHRIRRLQRVENKQLCRFRELNENIVISHGHLEVLAGKSMAINHCCLIRPEPEVQRFTEALARSTHKERRYLVPILLLGGLLASALVPFVVLCYRPDIRAATGTEPSSVTTLWLLVYVAYMQVVKSIYVRDWDWQDVITMSAPIRELSRTNVGGKYHAIKLMEAAMFHTEKRGECMFAEENFCYYSSDTYGHYVQNYRMKVKWLNSISCTIYQNQDSTIFVRPIDYIRSPCGLLQYSKTFRSAHSNHNTDIHLQYDYKPELTAYHVSESSVGVGK